jgi:hypothetical protein
VLRRLPDNIYITGFKGNNFKQDKLGFGRTVSNSLSRHECRINPH